MTYKVGVTTYPVYDFYDHRARPIEPYMGLPQHNRDSHELFYKDETKLISQT